MQKTQKNPHIQQNNNNRWWYFPLERLQFTFISSSPSIDKSQWNLNKLCILTVKKKLVYKLCSFLLFFAFVFNFIACESKKKLYELHFSPIHIYMIYMREDNCVWIYCVHSTLYRLQITMYRDFRVLHTGVYE